jgi:hypothetical protein
MLSCEQFRFLTGAAPLALGRLQELHLRDCPGCALEYRQLLAFERRIEQALMADEAPEPDQHPSAPGGRAC